MKQLLFLLCCSLTACDDTQQSQDQEPKPPIAITSKGGLTIPLQGSGIGINPTNGKITFEVLPGFHIEP